MGIMIHEGFDKVKAESLFEDDYNEVGFIIPNFLSSGECEDLKAKIDQLNIDDFSKIQEGFYTFPAAVAHKSDRKFADPQTVAQEDVEQSNLFRSSFAENFGINLETRLKETLSNVFQVQNVEVPAAGDEQDPLTPFSIRLLEPKAEIYLHCGNYVQVRHQEFYSRFSEEVQIYNQLSYFVVIQEPETDGELSVFNAKWKDVGARDAHEQLILENNEVKSPYSFGVHKAAPAKGALLVFSGGQYWHRVERVLGTKTRITIGGFIGKSKDGSKIFVWS